MVDVERAEGQGGTTGEIWNDFLTVKARPLGEEQRKSFENRTVLITGAGGYLGSALARVLATLPGVRLILLDHAEYGLYLLDQHLQETGRTCPTSIVVGSVLNGALLDEIFSKYAPHFVFHAAALKHVPLMQKNALAAAETNILGTQAIIKAAASKNSVRFVLLSTDKAVRPISVMGATKRIAEQMVLRQQDLAPERCIALRLCNVLGSTGSVAPLFARQAAEGRSLTLTHVGATRFFISESDAVSYLLRAACLPSGTGLMVPHLDEAQRVRDLADFILSQMSTPGRTSGVIETGLRDGDKLHEELLAEEETTAPSPDPDLLYVRSSFDSSALDQALLEIAAATRVRDRQRLFEAVRSAVPEYLPGCALPEEGQ